MDGSRSVRVRRVGVVLATIVSALGLVLVGTARAAVSTCSFNPTTHVATASLDPADTSTRDIDVVRSGTTVMFGQLGSEQACGTVTTLDTMHIDMAGRNDFLMFDLGHGPFAPGFTAEADGTSEIEFDVTNATDPEQVVVLGSSGDDSITAGINRLPFPHLETLQVFNLNAGQEGSGPDNDIAVHGMPQTLSIALVGAGGNNHLSANGTGAGTGAGPLNNPVVFVQGTHDDVMVGGNGNDVFGADIGGDGVDSFSGGPGRDEMDMGSRNESMSVSLDGKANDGIGCPGAQCEGDNIGADIEAVFTGFGNDTLTGGPGAQLLNPGPGDNTVSGGPGDDVIDIPESGADTVHGGFGFDAVTYEGHVDSDQGHQLGVTVSLDGVADDGVASLDEGDNIEPDVEAVYGTSGNDHLSGSSIPNSLYGELGDDVLLGGGGDDLLDGGGSRTGVGSPNDGDDTFLGGGGVDTVVEDGHSAGMRLSIDGLPNDVVVGVPAEGRDDIYTDVENVVGGPSGDTITGDDAANRLSGGGGNDMIRGLGGADALLGDAGDDTLAGGAGNDSLNGGVGTDICTQGAGTGSIKNCED